ncbi:MAG TPA: hypothetical protein PKN11_10115, partial [Anaerolineaceae bacterium]|nr:hypothetical protein [Anaerolineaceae bacterium]
GIDTVKAQVTPAEKQNEIGSGIRENPPIVVGAGPPKMEVLQLQPQSPGGNWLILMALVLE